MSATMTSDFERTGRVRWMRCAAEGGTTDSGRTASATCCVPQQRVKSLRIAQILQGGCVMLDQQHHSFPETREAGVKQLPRERWSLLRQNEENNIESLPCALWTVRAYASSNSSRHLARVVIVRGGLC